MVSRGGRSKGCTNCRRRRVKCDETRPICNRCAKRGLKDCDGPKEHTFINQMGKHDGAHTQVVVPFARDPPPQLSLAAFQDEVCLAFTRKILLRGGPVELACDLAFPNQSRNVADDPGLRLLRDSIRSIAITFFGKQHHQTMIEKDGYQQYGRVLRQLNTHLGTPGFAITDYTVLTALTCCLVEVFLPTAPDSFLKHIEGVDMLLAARGVPAEPSETTLNILRGLRILSIVGGLHLGKPSVYAREEWKKRIPSIQPGIRGRLRDDILGILADCTRFMAERDAILASDDAVARHVFLSQVRGATLELDAIHTRWQEIKLKLKTASYSGEKRRNANIHVTIDYLLYNAANIILLDIRESLEPVPDYVERRTTAASLISDCLEKRAWEIEEGSDEFRTIRYVATKVAIQVLGESHTEAGRKLIRMAKYATEHNFCQLTDIPIQARSFKSHDLIARKVGTPERLFSESNVIGDTDASPPEEEVPLQQELFDALNFEAPNFDALNFDTPDMFNVSETYNTLDSSPDTLNLDTLGTLDMSDVFDVPPTQEEPKGLTGPYYIDTRFFALQG